MAINDSYKLGLKKELVTAMRPLFGDTFPIPELRNKVYVGIEYPMEEVRFPAVYITYSEGPIENVGVGNIGIDIDNQGNPRQYKQFKFSGTVNFNILALTPGDRDKLSSAVVNILALGTEIPEFTSFFQEISDNDYILIHLLTDQIIPGGEVNNPGVPWQDEDEIVYAAGYSVNLFGEFFSDASTGDLIQISEVILYPYDPAISPVPW